MDKLAIEFFVNEAVQLINTENRRIEDQLSVYQNENKRLRMEISRLSRRYLQATNIPPAAASQSNWYSSI